MPEWTRFRDGLAYATSSGLTFVSPAMANVSIVVPDATRLLGGGESAKRQLTRITLSHVVAAVQRYSLDIGHAPVRLDDLVHKPAGAAYWSGPYLEEKELLDAWGRRLVYRSPGEQREFDVLSLGGDGKPGGDGPSAEDLASP
jgi:general secretion pathway protein G